MCDVDLGALTVPRARVAIQLQGATGGKSSVAHERCGVPWCSSICFAALMKCSPIAKAKEILQIREGGARAYARHGGPFPK